MAQKFSRGLYRGGRSDPSNEILIIIIDLGGITLNYTALYGIKDGTNHLTLDKSLILEGMIFENRLSSANK